MTQAWPDKHVAMEPRPKHRGSHPMRAPVDYLLGSPFAFVSLEGAGQSKLCGTCKGRQRISARERESRDRVNATLARRGW
jgi:hypothetical protein